MTRLTTFLCAAAMAGSAGGVAAQDFYAGLGLDYHKPHAGDEHSAAAAIVGASFGAGTLRYGAEADFATPIDGTETYDAMRLRGLGRYDFGVVTGLAAVGLTQYTADGQTFQGYNFGLGAEVPVRDALTLRIEMMRDMMDEDYTTNVTNTRLGLLYQF